MAAIKLISWNVNGIRAASTKGFGEFLAENDPDILCLQETKAHPDQLGEELVKPEGYTTFWASAQKKGYSGVSIFSKIKPLEIRFLGEEEFDQEGRVLIASYSDFTLLNCYFPNSQEAGKRLDYKLAFCDRLLTECNELRSRGENLVVCGDFNIAHKPMDLANPERNEKNPGYLPEERAWMDRYLSEGYLDTFRMFNQEPGNYTWWSYRFQARQKNIGWRIDYHCVNQEFENRIAGAKILSEVQGSDHCPVTLTIEP